MFSTRVLDILKKATITVVEIDQETGKTYEELFWQEAAEERRQQQEQEEQDREQAALEAECRAELDRLEPGWDLPSEKLVPVSVVPVTNTESDYW